MSDIVLGIKLRADGKGLVGQLTNAKGEVVQFGNASQAAGTKARTAGLNIGSMSAASGQLTSTLRNMFSPLNLIAGGFAALLATLSIREIIQYADEMTNLKNQLKLVSASTEELTLRQRQLLALANETRSDLSATIPLYTKLVRATRDLDVNQSQLLAVTKAVNQSFVISGASSAESAGSIRQLAQALASGTFRGDEFNSVAEQAPRLLQALADETGKSTGELREMAAQGQLTSELLIRALVNQSSKIDAEYKNMEVTVGQAMTVLGNNVKSVIGSFNEATGASNAFAGVIISIADGFGSLNAVIASGEVGAYLNAQIERWNGWAQDVIGAFNTVSKAVPEQASGIFGLLAQIHGDFRGFILDALKSYPENVRAMIQVLTVELASLIDVGIAYGKAFGQVVGVELAKLVRKAGIYGKELADIMAFWDGDQYDINAALSQADSIASGMTNSYLAAAEAQVDAARSARASVIQGIFDERQAALASYQEQIAAAGALGEARKQAAANDSSFDNVVPIQPGANGGIDEPNVTDSQLDKLRESLLSQEEVIALHLERKHTMLANAFAQGKLQEDEFISLSKAANQQYFNEIQAFNTARMNVILSSSQQIFGALAGLAKTFGGEQSKAYKVMFAVQKGFAIAQGILNLSTAISNASALPFPANIPAMAQAAATGMSLVQTIKGSQYQGQAHDGLARVPAANEGTFLLRRDEMVLNPQQRENFERVVENTKGGAASGGNTIQISHQTTIHIEGGGGIDLEQRIEAAVERKNQEFDAQLQEDFASNGVRSQLLRGQAA